MSIILTIVLTFNGIQYIDTNEYRNIDDCMEKAEKILKEVNPLQDYYFRDLPLDLRIISISCAPR